jgi:hypothetical protein
LERQSHSGDVPFQTASDGCAVFTRSTAGPVLISIRIFSFNPMPPPPRAPELNGQENIWQFMRQN